MRQLNIVTDSQQAESKAAQICQKYGLLLVGKPQETPLGLEAVYESHDETVNMALEELIFANIDARLINSP